jgi:hypothetical protein
MRFSLSTSLNNLEWLFVQTALAEATVRDRLLKVYYLMTVEDLPQELETNTPAILLDFENQRAFDSLLLKLVPLSRSRYSERRRRGEPSNW